MFQSSPTRSTNNIFQCHTNVYLDSIHEREYMISLQIKNFNIDDLKLIKFRPGSRPGFHKKLAKTGEI